MPSRNLTTRHCKRCRRGNSDMTCPIDNPLEQLLAFLAGGGYESYFDEIDARMARSPMSVCTNCGARGDFNYEGINNERSYRAFWTCRSCSHWVEV